MEPQGTTSHGLSAEAGDQEQPLGRCELGALRGARLGEADPAHATDIDGGEPRAIGPEGTRGALVSPDGRSLLAYSGEKTLLLPLDGGEPRAITGVEGEDLPIGWSGDGGSLYLVRFQGIAVQVHRLGLGTGRRELLHELALPDPAGTAPTDALAVSADGKSYAYSFIRNLSELFLVEGLK
jgi:hypothetical protein